MQKLAALEVKDSFVRRTAVAAHERPARGQAMTPCYLKELRFAGLDRGVKDNADIHHNVDEVRVCAMERAQASSGLVESQSQGPGGMHDHILQCGLRPAVANSCLEPSAVSPMIENEAQAVDITIIFPRFECS